MAGSDWKRVVATALDAFEHVTIEPASALDEAPPGSASITDVVDASLRDPVDRAPLDQLVAAAQHITVVVPDGRVHVSEEAVRSVIEFIFTYTRADAEVVALVATGWRPPPTGLAWVDVPQLAALARAGVPIAVHDTEQCVDVSVDGAWWRDAPDEPQFVSLNPLLTGADLVISIDRIELSHDTGFTGGYIGVSWGCAGADTLSELERMCSADAHRGGGIDPGDVPTHAIMQSIAQSAAPVFGVFEATTRDGRAFVSGEPLRATRLMAGRPGHGFSWKTEPFDAAIVLVDSIADASLLRATEPYTLLALQDHPPLTDHAPIVVVTACFEGVGCDLAGAAFGRALRDPSAVDANQTDAAYVSGVRRALAAREALERHPLMLVAEQVEGVLPAEVQRFSDLRDACGALVRHLRTESGEQARVLVTRDIRRSLPTTRLDDDVEPGDDA